MDGSNWKRVLLHWVNQLRFSERTFYNLEQTDIEEFFAKFREYITTTPLTQDDLKLFFKEQYPEFELHLDDENQISSADYMYAYSLLLHFSCVKCPQEYFHKICQSLNENYQQVIASFFKEVLEKDGLNRTNLRQAIADASPKVPLQYIRLDSPIRTPRDKFLPPTPKTNMLEEKTRELNFIKAQLDTERYEKGLLEVQLKQQDEQIEKLTQNQRKYAAEANELKNELLAKSTENYSPTNNALDEQIKKRLRKEIAEKEQIILDLRDSIFTLSEEKSLVAEKLSYTEKQVITCLEKIKEMDCIVNDLKTEIEKKDTTISFLTETKNDLEQFIEANRCPSGSHSDLNMSVECLDASRTTNSSGGLSSPENLGCSVIDIQLKEKESENAVLRQEIDKLKCDQSKLSKHIYDLIVRYADVFEICGKNVVVDNENTLPETFTVFDNYVKSLVNKYKLSMKNVDQLSHETNFLMNENKELKKRLSEVEHKLNTCTKQIETLEVKKSGLEKQNIEIQNKYDGVLRDIQSLNEERRNILNKVDGLNDDYCRLKSEKEVAEQNWASQIEELSFTLSGNRKEIKKIEGINEAVKNKICEFLEDINELEKKDDLAALNQKESEETNVCLERERLDLSKRVDELQQQLKQQEEKEEKLKTRLEEMVTLQEKFEMDNLETKKYVEKLERDYSATNDLLVKIERQSSALMEENAHFNSQIVDLTTVNDSLEKNHLQLKNEVVSLKTDISKKENECENLQKQLDTMNSEMQKLLFESEENNTFNSKKIKSLKKHIKECEIKIEDLSHKEITFQRLLERAQDENKLLSATVAVNETHHKELTSIIKKIKDEKKLLEDNNNKIKEDLQKKVDLLTKTSEHFKYELSSLLGKTDEGNFEQIKHALQNDEYSDPLLKQMQEQLVSILEGNNTLSIDKAELQKKIQQLEQRAEGVQAAKDKLIEKLNYSQQQIEQLETENRILEEDKCKYMNNTEELTKNFTFLENGYDELNRTNEKLEGIINSLEIELQSSCQDNMNLVCKIGELQSDNDMLVKKCKNLTDEVELIKSEMDKLKLKLDSTILGLKEEMRILQADHKAKEDEIMLLKKQCQEKSDQIKTLEAGNADIAPKIENMNQTLKDKENYISTLENENVKLQLKIKEMSASLSDLEKNLTEKWQEAVEKSKSLEKDLETLNASKSELLADLKKSEEAARIIRDELEAAKNNVSQLSATNTDLECDNKMLFEKLKSSKKGVDDAEQKHLSMKEATKKLEEEKLQAEEKLKRTEDEVVTLKDKILDMITQVNLINTEKDDSTRRNKDLSEELRSLKSLCNEKQKEINDLEDDHKKKLDQVKSLKASVAEVQKELSQQKSNYKHIQEELRITKAENEKLKENHSKYEEISSGLNKRLEKVSIKLGDSQARISKLEKENEALKKNFESTKALSESLQKDNAKHSIEQRLTKEKLSNLQNAYEKITTEHKLLGQQNKILKDKNSTLQQSETNLKKELEEIEKERNELDDNLKKLSGALSEMTGALECAKSENIKLDTKCAMLTLQVTELKNTIDGYQHKEVDSDLLKDLENKCAELSKELSQVQDQNVQLRQSNKKLEEQSIEMFSDNSKLVGEVAKLNERFKAVQKEHEALKKEVNDIQFLADRLRVEKENLEKENSKTVATLMETEARQTKLLEEKNSSQTDLTNKIKELEKTLEQKMLCINGLNEQLQNLKHEQNEQIKELFEKTDKLDALKKKLEETENLNTQELMLNEALNKDISIFKAKLFKHRQITEEKEKNWAEERNKLISQIKQAEERIKENRLELEGKLEKMKAKMKSIYNEEVAKIRNKHEKELCELRKEIHALSVKNEKYENHVQKLSKRNYQLNETILDIQKEIKFMETKMKDNEPYSSSQRRPHQPLSSQVPQGLGSDLRMEDEEGEVFNNTYLTDLQTGRMSPPFGRDSISLQELQYRNSLAPPHLRSTYMAQYADQHLREEDIKDGPINLDDSLSSLLHTGQKKKLSGTTSYKRPGPPTPSKNAGRLSFGGCIDFQPREILKETNDSGIVSKKATPNKLKNFFTSSKSRDEFSSPSDRKLLRRNRKSFPRPLGAQFTSTPRKSKAHYDQRRQLDILLNSSNSDNTGSDNRLSNMRSKYLVPAETDREQPNEKFKNWRQPNKNFGTESDTSESNTSCTGKNNNKINPPEKLNPKDRRVSFFYRGNIYARSKIPSKILRDQLKDRVKNQRCSNFNRFRKSLNEIKLRKSVLRDVENNENEQDEHPLDFDQKELVSVDFPFDDNNNDSQKFEMLMQQKISQAPFEVTELNCISSSFGSTMAMSKTLYAGSVIFNRKLPSVNTTMVRKTSFYIVNKNNKRIIALLPERKITCSDLFRMWGQLSNVARSVISLCFLVFLTSILALLSVL